MQIVAINWHVYILTKSPLALGTVGLVRVLPIIFCSLVGGVVADALDRKRLMLATQTVMLVSAALLAWMTAAGLSTVWPIYLLTAIASAAVAFDNPARQAMLPTLVPAHAFQNAVSLGILVFNSAMIVGPALAGLLLKVRGPALIYALNAGSFVAVIIALLLMRTIGRANSESPLARMNVAALKEGLRFVWRTPIIVQTMMLDFIATFFASANALLPIYAAEILAVGAGVWLTSSGAGRRFDYQRPYYGAGWNRAEAGKSCACFGCGLRAATVVFGLSRWFWLSLLMLGLTGASDTVSTVLRQTIRQLVTPDHLRGRMTSVNMIFFMGGPQLGEFEAGAVAALIGATLSVVLGGVGCLIAVAAAGIWARSLVQYEGEVVVER
jgi:MFS family permease